MPTKTPSNQDRIIELEKKVAELAEKFENLAKEPPAPAITVSTPAATHGSFNYPIPSEYREIVTSTLNSHFGIDITPRSDMPSFEFAILVPDKYSPMTEDQRRMVGGDIRAKVITYAEGPNGVKMWAEKVFSNFSPEVRAQILADRQVPTYA